MVVALVVDPWDMNENQLYHTLRFVRMAFLWPTEEGVSMMKKLLILLVTVLVVALLTIIPVALRSRLDASSAMKQRDSTPELHYPLSEQTPTIAETVTATAGTTPTSTFSPFVTILRK